MCLDNTTTNLSELHNLKQCVNWNEVVVAGKELKCCVICEFMLRNLVRKVGFNVQKVAPTPYFRLSAKQEPV